LSLSGRGFSEENEIETTPNIYLSKLLLFSDDIKTLAQQLRNWSESAININCLNTIGMYPVISKVQTRLGTLCMSIWLINNEARFDLFRAAYFSGVCHSIIVTKNPSDIELVRGLASIAPKGIPITFVAMNQEQNFNREVVNRTINNLNVSDQSRNIFYKKINSLEEISSVFEIIGQKIAQDIISGEYHTFISNSNKPANIYKIFNKNTFEKVKNLVMKIGYELLPDGIVLVHDKKFTFEVDFYRNQVKANITQCLNCPKPCKHYRKLCVVEEKKGYSNYLQFDNLQALAVLYALHDGSFYSLKGGKTNEDIAYQLERLWSLYEVNCPYLKDEGILEEKTKKQKRKKRR